GRGRGRLGARAGGGREPALAGRAGAGRGGGGAAAGPPGRGGGGRVAPRQERAGGGGGPGRPGARVRRRTEVPRNRAPGPWGAGQARADTSCGSSGDSSPPRLTCRRASSPSAPSTGSTWLTRRSSTS